MSDKQRRISELIEALKALSDVQQGGKIIVNSEMRTVISELMQELELHQQ